MPGRHFHRGFLFILGIPRIPGSRRTVPPGPEWRSSRRDSLRGSFWEFPGSLDPDERCLRVRNGEVRLRPSRGWSAAPLCPFVEMLLWTASECSKGSACQEIRTFCQTGDAEQPRDGPCGERDSPRSFLYPGNSRGALSIEVSFSLFVFSTFFFLILGIPRRHFHRGFCFSVYSGDPQEPPDADERCLRVRNGEVRLRPSRGWSRLGFSSKKVSQNMYPILLGKPRRRAGAVHARRLK